MSTINCRWNIPTLVVLSGCLFLAMFIYCLGIVHEQLKIWLKPTNQISLQPINVPGPVQRVPSLQINNVALNPKIITGKSLIIFIVTTLFLFVFRNLTKNNCWISKLFDFGSFRVVLYITMLSHFYCQNSRMRNFVIEYYNLA